MLVDTHTHLYLDEFRPSWPELIARAQEAGVGHFFLPNIDASSCNQVKELHAAFPDCTYMMAGLHPCSVKDNYEQELSAIFEAFEGQKTYAIGEIGLDFYWDTTYQKAQEAAFRSQIRLAIERDLPIAIHGRNAAERILAILKEEKKSNLRGVFHCFGENEAMARAFIELDFYLGIGGVLTFKNSGLDKVISKIDLKHLILETDSPYLAPVPKRGKRNESGFLPYVAAHLAKVKNTDLKEVATTTTANAEDLFNVKLAKKGKKLF